MRRVVVLSGGGLKGAVTAARCAADHEVVLVHADYGQPSAPSEARAVRAMAERLPNARVVELFLPQLLSLYREGGAARGPSGEVARLKLDEIPGASSAVLPMLLVAGVQAALRNGAPIVAIGLTRWARCEHLGLPGGPDGGDTRVELLYSFNVLFEPLLLGRSGVRVEAPLMELTYADVIRLGVRLNAPLEETWTCEHARRTPCGTCHRCDTRARAFTEAGLVDPLLTPSWR